MKVWFTVDSQCGCIRIVSRLPVLLEESFKIAYHQPHSPPDANMGQCALGYQESQIVFRKSRSLGCIEHGNGELWA